MSPEPAKNTFLIGVKNLKIFGKVVFHAISRPEPRQKKYTNGKRKFYFSTSTLNQTFHQNLFKKKRATFHFIFNKIFKKQFFEGRKFLL